MTASEGARCRCAASRVNRDEVRIKRDVVGLMLPISLGSSWIVEATAVCLEPAQRIVPRNDQRAILGVCLRLIKE